MPRLSKVSILSVWAILIIGLSASLAQKKPGGNSNLQLKAILSSTVVDSKTGLEIRSKIVNDSKYPLTPYASLSGTNSVYILAPNQSGEFVMSVVAKSRRAVRMLFDDCVAAPLQSSPQICGDPWFLYGKDIETTYFWIRSRDEFQVAINGSTTEFTPTGGILNFTKMNIGEIKGVILKNNFQFPGSTVYFTFQDPFYVLVKATDSDSDGVMDWILTPVFGPLSVYDPESRIWTDYPEGSVPRLVRSNVSPDCNYGTYRMPFELKIARLQ